MSPHTTDTPPSAVRRILRRRQGPMTEELARVAGGPGLGQLPRRLAPSGMAQAICGFCSTGCNLKLHLKDGAAVNLSPDPNYPVNLGMACPKGWESLACLTASDRGTTPLLRATDGSRRPIAWSEAADVFTARFKDIQRRHGPDSVAWLGTGQITTEELAFLGALGKFGMGFRHGDGNTRQCMATAVAAYKQSFGFDAPPFTYADFEASDVIVLVGSNLCIAHPILWQRIQRNPHRPEILVVDPRRTETAMAASQHLAIRPKSDLALLYGIAHLLVAAERVDREFIAAHTVGFQQFRDFIRAFSPDRVASETGLTVGQIVRTADTIGRGRAVSFWWTMGVNQGHQATRTAQAIINLALLTGNIGRPGTGANSITGQCNAMGSRLFSNTTNLLGGRRFQDPADRSHVAMALGIPEDRIPRDDSWAYDQIVEGIRRGAVKGLWIVATNAAHSWIHQKDFREVLARLEFLVVQDMYFSTETAALAHLFLPAAGWAEKEGTFINSERRIGWIQKAARPPGDALSDFNIFRLLANHWGCGDLFRQWNSPESVFRLLQACSAGQPCDITGIRGYAHLAESGGIQWPFAASHTRDHLAEDTHPRERRLFTDGRFFTPDQRARFLFEDPSPSPEPPDAEYPFVLLTGRGTSAQWHTQTRTAKSALLRQLYPDRLYVEIHPDDARRLSLISGAPTCVQSRRGQLTATAFVTATVPRGHVFLPMHYPEVNQLTLPNFDPHSRQPGYKHCAVAIAAVHPQP
ncbi:MAG: nitrate reductase [Verrucomicrobiales bacterium]|nr:nitrate reductase [Verrucomicrobiales bacterium]